MVRGFARRIFGTANDRVVREFTDRVNAINNLESEIENLSDNDLAMRTNTFREKVQNGTSLDDLMIPAFATVREAAKRTLGQRHYDVQLIGGAVLHSGKIAEMSTGEGKTLVATLPVYLNALSGQGVHVITVNDYLAKRDAEWMGQVYNKLGLTVGCITSGIDDGLRRSQYEHDVTYGTNNEFGFDYLRDNMKFSLESMVQRDFNFAIIDEVDSILIDESRTPLIISGPAEDSSEMYLITDSIIPSLTEKDYEIDEKGRSASLTDAGAERVEMLLEKTDILKSANLYDIENVSTVHHVNQALKAHKLFECDRDYIVKDKKVIIIDEFTGRMMEGRRFSDGLHQALEAKEKVPIQNENQTLASITFQNYFRMYPKLAGMTGTATTESAEFADIYGLDVIQIPTNEPCTRDDKDDEIYRTAEEKWNAIVNTIKDCQSRQQPVLVGTTSIEKSEMLSTQLKSNKIKHNVLNARYHQQEAHIIAQAGRLGAVTIATNMAGRGTDIQLGGNAEFRIQDELKDFDSQEEHSKLTNELKNEIFKEREKVIQAGGLMIIGSERHEARRIDIQLRGRSGRQGDPGMTSFFLSLEDDLMRRFGSERMDGMLGKLGLKKDEAIIHPWINKAIETAQKKVESMHYEVRKNLLKFDDVMNDQRKIVYEQRKDLMRANDVSETIQEMRHDVVEDIVDDYIPEKSYPDQWDMKGMSSAVLEKLNLRLDLQEWADEEGIDEEEFLSRLSDHSDRMIASKVAVYGTEIWRMAEKSLLLQILDQSWKEHLLALDHLRQGIGLRAYGQRDPLNEYRAEAFEMFEVTLEQLRGEITQLLAHVELKENEDGGLKAQRPPQGISEIHNDPKEMTDPYNDEEDNTSTSERVEKGFMQTSNEGVEKERNSNGNNKPSSTRLRKENFDPSDPSTWGRVGRNEKCPCGSQKKFKHCCGNLI
ncbi:MAG: preprotein translocase subunit SecA [Rhodospirillaceae bacterium]|nr:preprotein translocase subunit SecA [Rhodospirillaceae bacterium]